MSTGRKGAEMKFDIDGIIVDNIDQHSDERGFLIETFRIDDEFFNSIYRLKDGTYVGCPMSYISATMPNQIRGPHEHKKQTDVFCFIGSSKFEVRLWDNRPNSNTYKKEMKIIAEDSAPLIVVVPPGIVHGYKNIGLDLGYVINMPDKLYAGWDKKEKVDEIRWEKDENSPFKME